MRLDDIMAALSDLSSGIPGVAAVYLIGSAVEGRMRPDSDIDIALLPSEGKTLSLQDRLAIASTLEPRLGRTVDVGVIGSGNLIYASQAILKGKRIATFDIVYTEATENRLLGSYLQFLEDRREVEEAYRAA